MKALTEEYSDHRQRILLAQKSRPDRYLDCDNSQNPDSIDLGRSLEETASSRGFAAD